MTANRIYLDNAAGAPLRDSARDAILHAMDQIEGNPSSIHGSGRYSHLLINTARDRIAGILNAHASEIIFTSGGTEANNLAVKGLGFGSESSKGHVVSTNIEHAAVEGSLNWLEAHGVPVTRLPADSHGRISPQQVVGALRPDTRLVSLIWIHNELGTINPVEEIGLMLRERGILFHCDAVQTPLALDIDVGDLPVDALSFSAGKLGGPSGIGVLWLRKGTSLDPMLHGGHQEDGRRPGTENLLGINGFAAAWQELRENRAPETERLAQLRQILFKGLAMIPDHRIQSPNERTAPYILNVSFPGVPGEALFIRLDMAGIAVSNGSACSSGSQRPSRILRALGLDEETAAATIRVSWGYRTEPFAMERFIQILGEVVKDLREKHR